MPNPESEALELHDAIDAHHVAHLERENGRLREQLTEILRLDDIEPPSSEDDSVANLVRDALEHLREHERELRGRILAANDGRQYTPEDNTRAYGLDLPIVIWTSRRIREERIATLTAERDAAVARCDRALEALRRWEEYVALYWPAPGEEVSRIISEQTLHCELIAEWSGEKRAALHAHGKGPSK